MSKRVSVVAIIAVYNEEDIIGQVVRALIAEDVEVYLIDHRSTDRTVAEVEPYLGRGVIGIERFPAESAQSSESVDLFTWESLLRRKEALGRELRADWFIHHDADEFRESPWTGLGLREAIQRVDAAGCSAVDFQVLNFWPTPGEVHGPGDVREALRYYEVGATWDRVQIKCWKNTGQRVDLASSGGHEVRFAGRRVFPIRFLLRHYPIRSQAHGERKVFHERVDRFVPAERARGWHVQYEAFREGAGFLRDPTSLVLYDPEAVRLSLVLRHRDVEGLEQAAAVNQKALDELRSGFDRLHRHLEQQDAELDRLRPCVTAQEAQLEALRRHLRAQDEELERLRPCVTAQEEQLDQLRRHLRAQDAELERLRPLVVTREAQLDELRRRQKDQDRS